jgi:hypothetical protein
MDTEAVPSHHWEQKAKEALKKAKTMTSAEAKRLMYDVARLYRLMSTIASRKGSASGATRVRSRTTGRAKQLTQVAFPFIGSPAARARFVNTVRRA